MKKQKSWGPGKYFNINPIWCNNEELLGLNLTQNQTRWVLHSRLLQDFAVTDKYIQQLLIVPLPCARSRVKIIFLSLHFRVPDVAKAEMNQMAPAVVLVLLTHLPRGETTHGACGLNI